MLVGIDTKMNDRKVVKSALNNLRMGFNGRNGRSGSVKTGIFVSADQLHFNPLSKKLYMSDLKAHFLPRSKNSLPRL